MEAVRPQSPPSDARLPLEGPNARAVWSWALFDWANSAFVVTVISAFFPLFLKRYWSVGLDPTVSTFQLGVANAIGGVLIALLAPLLGAIADQGGRKKRYLILFTAMGVVMTAALPFVARGEWQFAVALYALAVVGLSGSTSFYDALLVDVATPDRYDQVSGLGYGLGYLGGGVLFAVSVAMTLSPARFGLADATEAVRVSFGMVAIWWAVFTLPLAFFVHEPPVPAGSSRSSAMAAGLARITSTFREVRQFRVVLIFLIAYWLYIDGVATIARMAIDYGMALGLDEKELIVALLITQFVGFPAAIAFGYLGARAGAKTGIYIGIGAYVVATLWSYFMKSVWEFYVLAIVIGLVQGAVQLLSRSLFARIAPRNRSAEFFGFLNMSGRFAAILGPLLVGFTALATGSSRLSVLVIALLFIAGALVLRCVDEEEGMRVARASESADRIM